MTISVAISHLRLRGPANHLKVGMMLELRCRMKVTHESILSLSFPLSRLNLTVSVP